MPDKVPLTVDAQQKLLELVFARADALNGFWNLYIAVALGVLGLMASGKPFTEARPIKLLLTVAFAAFAYSNYDVIRATNFQRTELLSLLNGSLYYAAASHAAPPATWKLNVFHGALDLLVLLVVWLVPWHRPSAKEHAA
jgi:hypothetical protein